mgnify:CR=1 FL=1
MKILNLIIQNDSKKGIKTMNKSHNDYLLMKALNYKYSNLKPFGDVLDYIEQTGQKAPIPIKNVCAKVPETLANELEEVCNILSMSKREFIEMAIIMMIEEVNTISVDHDIHCDNRGFTSVSDDSEKQEDLPL